MVMSSAWVADDMADSATRTAGAIPRILLKRMAFSLSVVSSQMTARAFYQMKMKEHARARGFFNCLLGVTW
jgi:hypothetical protein